MTTNDTQLDDEDLFQATVILRQAIAAANGDEQKIAEAKAELKVIEIERGTRRAASYPDGHPKRDTVLAGVEKLRAEGFSDEAQSIGG